MDQAIALAQQLVDALNSLKATVTTPTTVSEVDVKQSDGTDEKFVPETPAA